MRGDKVGSRGKSERSNSNKWGASSYRSIGTSDMLAGWRAKYGIPSLVELVVHEPSDCTNAPPVGCVALNSTILNDDLKVSFSRVVRKFLSS